MVGNNSTDGLNNAESKKALNKSNKFDSTNECVNTCFNTSIAKNQHIINDDKEYIKKSSSYSSLTGEQSEEMMRTSFFMIFVLIIRRPFLIFSVSGD